MNKLLLSLTLALVTSVNAQVFGTDCPTIEQQQEAYNKKKAQAIAVKDTYTQQLQCHYWQLGVYFQQLDKTNQQKAKDEQQAQKDIQQAQKDAQQVARDAQLNAWVIDDELTRFLDVVIPLMENMSCHDIKEEFLRIHTNRSGHADGTNPGGQTHNINGFDNPHNQ